MTKNDEILIKLIESGSEIAGGAVGGALGFLLAGPVGAATAGSSGVLVTKVFNKIGNELKTRFLGTREEVRIGATISLAATKIKNKIDEGEKIREDNFFTNTINDRSDADEVYEALLISAQKEYEEKKIELYSNLLCNIAFDEEIDKLLANQLIKLAKELSYRQLCLLNIIMQSYYKKAIVLYNGNYRNVNISKKVIPLLYDLMDLSSRHLINNSTNHVFGLTDVNPSEFTIHGLGILLFEMMELNTIDDKEINQMASLLSE